ncbi:hypothetical protein CARUB_v10018437mg [Capsella rubella]|uniref:Reticulon-like protein n=1 Tax=Capsella rubella TaxID=81985 RepID=R0HMH6_9BRAS|nr:hypothetical protein CARUB_v10018437mg [Capsella rubella]
MCVEGQDKLGDNTCNCHTFLVPLGDHGGSICSTPLFNPVTPHAPPLPLGQLNLPDSRLRALLLKTEGILLMLYEIAYGKDIKTFLWTIFYVVIIDIIGSYISLLTMLYICLVCSMTTPVLYLQFQEVIDSFIGKVSEEKNNLIDVFKSTVASKIPRATKVE